MTVLDVYAAVLLLFAKPSLHDRSAAACPLSVAQTLFCLTNNCAPQGWCHHCSNGTCWPCSHVCRALHMLHTLQPCKPSTLCTPTYPNFSTAGCISTKRLQAVNSQKDMDAQCPTIAPNKFCKNYAARISSVQALHSSTQIQRMCNAPAAQSALCTVHAHASVQQLVWASGNDCSAHEQPLK